jgi:glucokinase
MRERLGKEYNTKVAHVSVERVLSGMGLHNIYDFLKHKGELKEPDWLAEELKISDDIPAAISRAAFEKNVEICVEALNMLATIYGSEAGNLALKLLATAGVFIGGGIAPKILPKLKEPHFMNAFVEKGRMKPLLQKIPIKVITNSKTALIGAAKAGREQFSRLEASIR